MPGEDGKPVTTPVERMAVAFAAGLRRAGLPVATGSVAGFVSALGAVGIDERAGVYWCARATLVHRPEDIRVFDDVFAAFWLQRELVRTAVEPERVVIALDDVDDSSMAENETAADAPTRLVSVRYSPVEVLREKDFSRYTTADFEESRRLMAALRMSGAARRSHRLRPSRGTRPTGHPDLRRTVRRSMRRHGELIERKFLVRTKRPRRIVLLCDVSGSMEPYTRALLRFLHAAVAGRGGVEAFAFGTRLTRLTRELSSHDPDAALLAASSSVGDWSGGTRLGETMRAFNDEWGVRGTARGAVVVILSDGWDRGDSDVLAQQMARLQRVAHRVVWVNPLKATEGYAPLARGMAAALPYVDEFVEGHSFTALEALAKVVARP